MTEYIRIRQSATYLAETKSKSTKFWNIIILADESDYYLMSETWTTKADGANSIRKTSSPRTVYRQTING